MKIYGLSILQGMMVTLGHFLESYVEDFKRLARKAENSIPGSRTLYDDKGVCTVQYPEEELPITEGYERFRVIPYLLYEQEQPADPQNIRCTACGICAKVCPPQCIWIVQETNEAGKPVPTPEAFYIDMSVCMNCGLCSEFCPFDAIKMSHDYALSARGKREDGSRFDAYLYDMTDKSKDNPTGLLVHVNEYARTHPVAWKEEEDVRKAKEAKKAAPKPAAAKKDDSEAPAEKPARPVRAAKAEGAPPETPPEKPGEQPVAPPPEAPPPKPAEQPAAPPPETPAEKPGEQPASPPPETPPETPVRQPAVTPPEVPPEKPSEQPAMPPAETPAEKPGEQPAAPPEETPAEKPGEQPSGPPPEVPAEPPTLQMMARPEAEAPAVEAPEAPGLRISPDMVPREQDMVSEGGPVTEETDPSVLEVPKKPKKTSSKPKASSPKKKTSSKAKKQAEAEE